MKLGSLFVALTAYSGVESAEFYKAPFKGFDSRGHPFGKRHMSRVMQNASKMMCTKVTKNYEKAPAGQRVCKRFAGMAQEMVGRMDRKKCFYYNPDVKLGGPNPEEGSEFVRWWGNKGKDGQYRSLRMMPRVRRDEDEDESEDYDGDDYYGIVTGCDDIDPDADGDLAEFCDTEYDYQTVLVDVPCEGSECLTRGKRVKKQKIKKVRLTRPEKAMKRSLLSVSSWCYRHLRDCSGMRLNKNCLQRMKKFWDNNRPKIKNHAKAVESNERVIGGELFNPKRPIGKGK